MENQNKINWKKELLPSLAKAIIFGAISILVAFTWEYFKFKRETQFEKRVDMIIENRRQVTDIYIEVDQIRRQIKSNEIYNNENGSVCNPDLFKNYVDRLKSLTLKLNYVDELNKNIINSDSIKIQIDSFKGKMKEYIICIESNKNCEICTDKVPDLIAPLERIIGLHTDNITNLVK